jgi:hypothetical protein
MRPADILDRVSMDAFQSSGTGSRAKMRSVMVEMAAC